MQRIYITPEMRKQINDAVYQKHLKGYELANLLGVNESTVSRISSGKSTWIYSETVKKLESILSITISSEEVAEKTVAFDEEALLDKIENLTRENQLLKEIEELEKENEQLKKRLIAKWQK